MEGILQWPKFELTAGNLVSQNVSLYYKLHQTPNKLETSKVCVRLLLLLFVNKLLSNLANFQILELSYYTCGTFEVILIVIDSVIPPLLKFIRTFPS